MTRILLAADLAGGQAPRLITSGDICIDLIKVMSWMADPRGSLSRPVLLHVSEGVVWPGRARRGGLQSA